MRIGVAYYPEHWPEDRWAEDAHMMKDMGIDVVRIGEFAWSRIEPRRLQYDTDWMKNAIDVLANEGLKVILATPTAAPPQWLFIRHPSMVPLDVEGKRWFPGSRRGICLNSRPYRRYVKRIVREVAKAFGNNENVCAWQIDNELGSTGSGTCYCDDCEQAFREWLKRRYGTIERLNKLWCTEFWSQHVNDWHEIPAPRRTSADPHPSLVLDYKRFTSATLRNFVQLQRDIIEHYSNETPAITTNSVGLFLDNVDQFSFNAPLDVASYDNYPADDKRLNQTAQELDITRSAKNGPFWVMEQQAGPTLVPTSRSQPRAGQLRLWSYQAAARGAELINYFRWRTCAAAQEMHWYGILDADGKRRRRFDELKETFHEIKDRAPLWDGRLPDARVAIVLDYNAYWAFQGDGMYAQLDYLGQVKTFHTLLREMGLAVDFIPPERDPSGYSVVIAPMPVIGRLPIAKHWEGYVKNGGVMLVTAPAGYRNENNGWLTSAPPGPYGSLLGVEVVEHDVLRYEATTPIIFENVEFVVSGLCSVLNVLEAEVVATYGAEYYAGQAAVTRKKQGEGLAYFLAVAGGPEVWNEVLKLVLRDAAVEPDPWSSETVEVIPLTVDEGEEPRKFVLNHSEEPVELALPDKAACRDLLTETEYHGAVSLAAYGVVLLEG